MPNECKLCKKPGSKLCSGCHSVCYCTVEHQKLDWKNGHKSSCRAWTVKSNDLLGRFVIAARDIPAGTILMNQHAIVIGPKQDSLPICLGCHKRVHGIHVCSKCSLPVCNTVCEKAEIHANNECRIFCSRKPIAVLNYDEHHPIYESIMAIRCLCLKDSNPKAWEKLIEMEHHNCIRKQNHQLWNRNENNVIKFLTEVYNFNFDAMTIHSVLGYIDVNALEIKKDEIEICGLFPEVYLMAHDCTPNTHHTVTEDNRMVIRSSVPIRKGELITLTYTFTLDGTLDRRKHIKLSKFFDCVCDRCSSPTELGLNFSSVKCTNCPGYLIPKDSLNSESIWNCDTCNEMKSNVKIQALLEPMMKKEIESFETNPEETVTKLERVLERCSGKIVHPQHYLMVSIMHSLTQFYGRAKFWEMHQLTLNQLQRKEELCRSLLKVLDVIEPGLSRIRGSTMYELHAAILFSSQIRFKNGEISKSEFKNQLKEVIQLLEESMQILSFDDPKSSTGKLGLSIPNSIKIINQILENC